ncbi:MAG: cytochrome c [Verrucomicrobiota bacterium]
MKNHLLLISAAAFIASGLNASAADGSAVFAKDCAKCHGAAGKGDTPMGKKLSIKELGVEQAKLSDAEITKIIKEGLTADGKLRMKPIKDVTDEEIQAVIKHIRTLKN